MKIKLDDFKRIVVDYYAEKKPSCRITSIEIFEKNTGFITDDWFKLKIEGSISKGEKSLGFKEIIKRKDQKKIVTYWFKKNEPRLTVHNVILSAEGIMAITKPS